MSSWREGLDGDCAWLSLVGDVSVEEFLASAGTDDIRGACRAHAELLPRIFLEVSEEDIPWVTEVLSAHAEQHRSL